MTSFHIKPLDETTTWPDFARLVEKHDGAWVAATWGANMPNSPVLSVNYWYLSAQAYPQLESFPPIRVFAVVVNKWSDGTPAPSM